MKELKSIFVKIAMFRKLYDKDFLWGKKIFMEKSLNYNSSQISRGRIKLYSLQFSIQIMCFRIQLSQQLTLLEVLPTAGELVNE